MEGIFSRGFPDVSTTCNCDLLTNSPSEFTVTIPVQPDGSIDKPSEVTLASVHISPFSFLT